MHAQLKTSEADVKRLIAERRELMAKFADTEVVEGAVRELYVQMKVRPVAACGDVEAHSYASIWELGVQMKVRPVAACEGVKEK
eukprot:scaffold6452_cov20-Tisochrysis_lutea.AAC.3